jgi:iron complex transport system substrate-binding protein
MEWCCALLLLLAYVQLAQAEAKSPRLLALAPNLAELAYAAGAGDHLVGTVAYSDYPEAARALPRVGDAFRVDMERVLALHPDVVLAWESGTPRPVIERLQQLGLRVVSLDAHRLADVRTALLRIGALVDTTGIATRAADEFDASMSMLRHRYARKRRVTVFIQVGDRPLYTVNGAHIISEVVALCGGANVFASLQQLAPVVSVEAVLAANPDVILATSDTVSDARAAWARWPQIAAVRGGNVFTVSSDDIARTTLRLARGARIVCEDLDKARIAADATSASH